MATVTTITTTTTVTTESGPPRMPLTLEETEELYRRWNAAKAVPSPLCGLCGMPYQRGDADPFDRRVCTTCGINRMEERVRQLFRARGKKARERALRRLYAIRRP